jgi:myo-inositol 2-dehydrogenase / D-chiro-inositol 1-dehydrogenase
MQRRDFIRKTTASGIALGVMPTIVPSTVLGKGAPSNRINVAMIGCGRQTANINIPQIITSEIARITAVCDVDSWRLENARKQVDDAYSEKKGGKYKSCKAYEDYREIIQDKDIDAVMISTPDHWHVPMAIESARAGKHISLEKPISTCVQHGRELVKAIQQTGVITRNDSEFRTIPEFSRAVELVRNGRIGKIKRIHVAVPAELNGAALPPQLTMPVPEELNYDMWLGPAFEVPYTEKRVHAPKEYGRPGWMRVDSYCNGMITNWGAHLMGIAQWGNNSEYTGPVAIEGRGAFDKGLWNSLNEFDIRYQFADGVEVLYKIERPYVRFEGSEGWVEIEYPDKLTASSPSILDAEIGKDEMQIRNLPSDKDDFLRAVKEGKQSLEPLETAHRTISMCQLGLISIQTGSALKWDPVKEQIIGDNAAAALLNRPIREKYFSF